MDLSLWGKAYTMFVQLRMRSFQEVSGIRIYSLDSRVKNDGNVIFCCLNLGEAKFVSTISIEYCIRLALR